MNIRHVTRVVTLDQTASKILLVKNQGQNFWYPPGGGWEHEKETLVECGEREVYEETGLRVKVMRLLYLREFHDGKDSISLEIVWLAKPVDETTLDSLHVDQDIDGKVEAARWFSKDELQELTIYPQRLKDTFWDKKDEFSTDENPFILA